MYICMCVFMYVRIYLSSGRELVKFWIIEVSRSRENEGWQSMIFDKQPGGVFFPPLPL